MPVPAKKSRTRSFSCVDICINFSNKASGLGVVSCSKSKNNFFTSCLPFCVFDTSLEYNIETGIKPCLTSEINFLTLGIFYYFFQNIFYYLCTKIIAFLLNI